MIMCGEHLDLLPDDVQAAHQLIIIRDEGCERRTEPTAGRSPQPDNIRIQTDNDEAEHFIQ